MVDVDYHIAMGSRAYDALADSIDWAHQSSDNIVWGNDDNIVWGFDDGDNIVWGNNDCFRKAGK